MIEIKRQTAPSAFEFAHVFHGIRNPYNSWDRSDSVICYGESCKTSVPEFIIGEKDLKLARNLINSGVEHAKFLRQLPILLDINAPLYWHKQADQYKIGTTTDSQSTMHCLTKKEFSLDDFSLGELSDENYYIESGDVGIETNIYVGSIITTLNALRDRYIDTGEKKYWNAINRLLPQSYNQMRTWSGNYAVLFNICSQRAGHPLSEWDTFIRYVVENVPYFRELCYDKLCKVSPAFKEMYERVA